MNNASGGEEIPVELFQILKDDAVKVLHSICQQIWKIHSGHRTGKGQFSFQSQRKAMPKNAQTTAQLHSSHTLVKPGFSSMWTVNFQMFKLVLEKAEEPEIKMPASAGSSKKQESSRKLLYWLCQAFDCVDHNNLWKILQEMGIPEHLTCLLRNLYAGQEARTGHGTTDWFQIGKGVHQGCILSPCLLNLYAEYIMRNTGWSTSWNHDCWKKYQ